MEGKILNCQLEVSDKNFTNKDTGEVIKYKEITAIIDGVRISLSIKDKSRDLFDYVLGKIKG